MLDMRVLVISDVHANSTALEAVLQDVSENASQDSHYDAVWCLGDLVGYGPDPNECIQRVRSLPQMVCLIGNHDLAALGDIPLSRFNKDARDIAAWTQKTLTEENRDFLRSLPSTLTVGEFTLAHGSPRQPVWEYILEQYTADRNFEKFQTDYCLVGHSHLPLIFHRQSEDEYALPVQLEPGDILQLTPRIILNPGSVGQPRDLDPRASYAVLDTEALTWENRRTRYDVAEVQLRILRAGLPERQALRLVAGW